MDFKTIVAERYATKKFSGEEVSRDKIDMLINFIRFAPSSLNLQPWKLVVIKDHAMKEQLLAHSYSQEQVTTCSHLIVFCVDTDFKGLVKDLESVMLHEGTPQEKVDGFITMVKGYISRMTTEEEKLHWAARQVYLALGNALNGAKQLELDSCPMEGFDAPAYKKLLDLPEHLTPLVLCPVGYAADTPRSKTRFNNIVYKEV